MTTSPTFPNCPNCGANLPEDAGEGLCPRCLVEAAAWTETAPLIPGAERPRSPKAYPLPQPGEVFGGYQILRSLGQGGMGAVYEADEIETGRRLALKVLSHRLDSPSARTRFLREGRLAASINHPNSVYVFGTEEIEGTPAITMELVPGGTLHDRVANSGPMPVPEAIDAIIQIIAGLEAAEAIGILHRDIKPSNCFQDGRGGIKVGDFGLSISTRGRRESLLTMQGTILGTPAFSSPEQLRGDDLNARSDMYSVGATLFYLLTGHPPFDAPNTVKVLARVLEEPARSPRVLRPEIPPGLARIVVRCLSKVPAERFRTYAELAAALAPFSSEAPGTATLALRVAAYVLDSVLLAVVGTVVQVLVRGRLSEVIEGANFAMPAELAQAAGLTALALLYFAVAEGRWGATVGKAVCRLGVVGPDGAAPGYARALVRVLVFEGSIAIPYLVFELVSLSGGMDSATPQVAMMVTAANCVIIALLFSTARRGNGYAALHDLAGRSRVVRRASRERRPALAAGNEIPASDTKPTSERIGPYEVIETLTDAADGRWLLGFDGKLLRRVWIHAGARGKPPVPVRIRNVNRIGRLRWIGGRRGAGAEENWDAYESLDGQPLTTILSGPPQPWATVRYWLLDLAEELRDAEADDSLPDTLGIGRIWITREGRAKLLDLAPPGSPDAGASESPDPVDAIDRISPQSLLASVARLATRPEIPRRRGAADGTPPLPLHARRLVGAISSEGRLEEVVAGLRANLGQLGAVSRRRRLGMVATVSVFPLVCVAALSAVIVAERRAHQHYPDLERANQLALIARDFSEDSQRDHLRRHLAHEFRDSIQEGRRWESWAAGFILNPGVHSYVAESVADHPDPTPEEITAARSVAETLLAAEATRQHRERPLQDWENPVFFMGALFMIWAIGAALPSVLAALIARGGFLMRLAGVAVVRSDGRPAGRLHTCVRSLIAWSPLALVLLLRPGGLPLAGPAAIILVCGLVAYSTRLPDRGLHDRIARTWLVPR